MKKINRTKRITVRLTPEENNSLLQKKRNSTHQTLNDYVRQILFKQRITVIQRDESLDDLIQELTLLRQELNALGNNFNQVVKKINAVSDNAQLIYWSAVANKMQVDLNSKVEIIKGKINKIADRWLQS